MTDYTDKLIEQRIADMTAEQFDALVARTRPPNIDGLKERAAAMMRGEPTTETPSWNPTSPPAPKSSDKDRAAAEIRNHLNPR